MCVEERNGCVCVGIGAGKKERLGVGKEGNGFLAECCAVLLARVGCEC